MKSFSSWLVHPQNLTKIWAFLFNLVEFNLIGPEREKVCEGGSTWASAPWAHSPWTCMGVIRRGVNSVTLGSPFHIQDITLNEDLESDDCGVPSALQSQHLTYLEITNQSRKKLRIRKWAEKVSQSQKQYNWVCLLKCECFPQGWATELSFQAHDSKFNLTYFLVSWSRTDQKQ